MCEIRMARILVAVFFAIALGVVAATTAGVHSAHPSVSAVQPASPADTFWD